MSDGPGREYEDGAFYWATVNGKAEIILRRREGSLDGNYWWRHGHKWPFPTCHFDEIGPCLGERPPTDEDADFYVDFGERLNEIADRGYERIDLSSGGYLLRPKPPAPRS